MPVVPPRAPLAGGAADGCPSTGSAGCASTGSARRALLALGGSSRGGSAFSCFVIFRQLCMNSLDFCKASSLASLETFVMIPSKSRNKNTSPHARLARHQKLQGKRRYKLTQSMHGRRSFKSTQSMHGKKQRQSMHGKRSYNRHSELTQMHDTQSTYETDMRDWQRLGALAVLVEERCTY